MELTARETTRDAFLNGRLTIVQPAQGFRAAVDSVLLPAAISRDRGAEVLDAGAGAGVAALCLLSRDPAFKVTGYELQGELARLARKNAAANRLELTAECRDLLAPEGATARFDQVMTNPPFIEAGRGTAPPEASKALAHVAPALGAWIAACLRRLRPRGTLTLIHRADRLAEVVAHLEGRAGDITIFPLWPHAGEPARRVIVRARLGAKGGAHVLAGLVLHQASGSFTPEADAVLRGGALDLG